MRNFKAKGNSFSVDFTAATVAYDLKNDSCKPIKFGKYGAFIACRDPNSENRNFAHQYKFYKLEGHRRIHVRGRIKVNKRGLWIFSLVFTSCISVLDPMSGARQD